MPRLEAASISWTSTEFPEVISKHDGHVPSGVTVGPVKQLSALARMRAVVVFPTPRAPEKMYPWATRSVRMAFFRVSVTRCWPTTSSKVWGRYLRAMTWQDMGIDQTSGDLRHPERLVTVASFR